MPRGGLSPSFGVPFLRQYNFSRGIDSVKVSLLDSWASGSLLAYPKLFSEVLALVELVPARDRQRAIVLNYWRERAVRHTRLSEMRRDRHAVADEGLVQTLLSTVIRIPGLSPSDPKSHNAISRVIEHLPPIDLLVNIRVSPEDIRARNGSPIHWGLTEATAEWLDTILGAAGAAGIDLCEIDGSNSAEKVRMDFEHQLMKRGRDENR